MSITVTSGQKLIFRSTVQSALHIHRESGQRTFCEHCESTAGSCRGTVHAPHSEHVYPKEHYGTIRS